MSEINAEKKPKVQVKADSGVSNHEQSSASVTAEQVNQTSLLTCARKPYPAWTYVARGLWKIIELSLWRLCWKRISFLRPTILKLFGASLPFRGLISGSVRFYFPWAFSAGEHIAISDNVTFYNLAGIHLGSRVIISQDVYLCGGTHDYTQPNYPLITMPIIIQDDVWIGAGAFIGPGILIGEGAVIGARAVVTKDVEPWTVVAGNPARIIKNRTLKSY